MQPEPQDEVSDQEKGDTIEKPRNQPEKADNKRLSNVICLFFDWVMTWSVSILLIPLQVISISYALCLVCPILLGLSRRIRRFSPIWSRCLLLHSFPFSSFSRLGSSASPSLMTAGSHQPDGSVSLYILFCFLSTCGSH
jgi:hypothetical protein